MKNRNVYTALLLSMVFICSCGVTDDRESKAHDFLQQKITEESKGFIKLNSFKKTNGYDQNILGEETYVLEWLAEVSIEQKFWKEKNWNNDTNWKDFVVYPKSKLDMLDMTQNSFDPGTVEVTGESDFRKTENGWRNESYSIKSTKVISKK